MTIAIAGSESSRSRPAPWSRVALALLALSFGTTGGIASEEHPGEEPVAAAPGEPAVAPGPALALEPCELPRVEGEARCGTLSVWEDRAAREGRRIALRVAVLPATGGDAPTPREPDPLFVVMGGPGQSAVQVAFFFNHVFAEARRGRDLVLVDQRGTGGSNPLDCTFPGDDVDPQSYLGDQMPAGALAECLGRLDADPRHYTTTAAVADLEEVRAALGYERVNFLGLSYGSRVALVYMRQHPGRVRSAILAGAVPTDMAIPTHHAPDSQRALDILFDECAADAACAAAYPRLRERFWEVWERLGEEPVKVDLIDPQTERPITLELDRDLFNEEIRWRLYDQESNLVPPLIDETHRGDFRNVGALLLRLRRAVASGAILATGMFMSITCTEDVPFIDLEEARRLAEGTFLGMYRVEQQRKACEVWPRGVLPVGFADPVRSEAPVLILSGRRDPVTPPRWGERVLAHLPNGRHVVLQEGFHPALIPCERQLMNRFLVAGSAADLDASCAEEMPKTPWVLPGEEIAID